LTVTDDHVRERRLGGGLAGFLPVMLGTQWGGPTDGCGRGRMNSRPGSWIQLAVGKGAGARARARSRSFEVARNPGPTGEAFRTWRRGQFPMLAGVSRAARGRDRGIVAWQAQSRFFEIARRVKRAIGALTGRGGPAAGFRGGPRKNRLRKISLRRGKQPPGSYGPVVRNGAVDDRKQGCAVEPRCANAAPTKVLFCTFRRRGLVGRRRARRRENERKSRRGRSGVRGREAAVAQRILCSEEDESAIFQENRARAKPWGGTQARLPPGQLRASVDARQSGGNGR